MNNIYKAPMSESADFARLCQAIREGVSPCSVFGVSDSQKVHLSAAALEGRAVLFVTYTQERAERAAEDFKTYLKVEPVVFPARTSLLRATAQSHETTFERITALYKIMDGAKVVTASIEGLLQKNMPKYRFEALRKTITLSTQTEPHALAAFLVEAGYTSQPLAEHEGQFSLRGGILDIFPVGGENLVRLEFFGDEIDSMRLADAQTQRSIRRIDQVEILPAKELCISEHQRLRGKEALKGQLLAYVKRAQKTELEAAQQAEQVFMPIIDQLEGDFQPQDELLPYFFTEYNSILDFMPEDTVVVLDEPKRLRERGDNTRLEFEEQFKDLLSRGSVLPLHAKNIHPVEDFYLRIKENSVLALQSLTTTTPDVEPRAIFTFATRSMQSFQNKLELLAQELTAYQLRGYKVVICAGGKSRGSRLVQELELLNVYAQYTESETVAAKNGEVFILPDSITHGFEYPEIKFALISDKDIFTQSRKKLIRKAKKYKGGTIESFAELTVGDYIVHESHGIGVYEGIVKIQTDGVFRDFITIRYQGTDKLYVPVEQMDKVQKYIGGEEAKPKVNKLGSKEWANTKAKVKRAIADMTDELIALYRARENTPGHAFAPDTPWQKEFEDDFPYEETPDQLQCIDEIKADMESGRIMDRLLCGDVGYGKTEVALRAAFKAVMDGKQVAFLAPTTILVQQHYNTVKNRMANFGINIEHLSRFRTLKEKQRIISEIKAGTVDIVVGTHALLSKEVQFKDLGLLIIDEEQRFGVAHKEKIKQIKKNVDVLTLTATPIPRTLHMSLIGVRDMSIIENPPEERYPVQTYVVEYNRVMIRDAIVKELSRGGQVYYVYNRVQSIDSFAIQLSELVPEAKIAIGHGQMPEAELEKVMLAFYNGDYDILLCTTIIESGLDISRVNTIIVHDADKFGLSQLYQLRGRVGRSNRLAYAYFTFQRDKVLTEVAEKRLNAIRELTEFGSGFKIAMRDLEIRGAGNLLGAEQHGHMAQVGYDLYCKLIKETVLEAQGKTEAVPLETSVDLKIDAYIDSSYIKNEVQKLNAYKRIAAIGSKAEMDDVLDELIDRYGEPPYEVINLLNISYLRSLASRAGIMKITQKDNSVTLTYAPGTEINF